jgi:hypothetical protein
MDGSNYFKLWKSMNDNASNWEKMWQESADWCLPRKDNITSIRVQGMEKPAQRMIDTCVEANWNFASGFFSYMFPSQTVWAKIKHPVPSMMDDEEVADYYERVSRLIHGVIIESNFAQEQQEALLDLGCFGTNCMYGEEDDDSIVRFKSFTVSDFRIMLDNKGRVDTVGREMNLTARQMIQEFSKEELKQASLDEIIDIMRSGNEKYDSKYGVIHIVRKRSEYDPSKINKENKPFASVYISSKTKQIIKEGGYDYMPYFVGRFSIGNCEDYGRGPMSMSLSTARRTNSIYKSMLISAENHANPQWLIPDDDSVTFTSNPNRAGAIVKFRSNSPLGKPERLTPNGDPGIAQSIFELHEAAIRRIFFNHLFRPLDEYRNMTAFEVNQRMSTDLMALAPFVNRYQDEVINKIVSFVYYVLAKRNMLPEMPDKLKDSPEFEIEYVGKLSLATKNFEVSGAFQTLQMFTELAQYVPQMAQPLGNVDGDKLFRQSWFANSASMNALKSPETVQKEREAAAEAQKQQQLINNLPNIGDAVLKGGKAPEEGSPAAMIMGQ